MKTWSCKVRLAATVACLTLGGAALAHAGACSNASLKGKYGQSISGELLPGGGTVLPQNGIAMTLFDGEGKFTQEDFVVINGSPVSSGFETGETGTYKINPDCTGTATINYPDGSWIDLELIVLHRGSEFHSVVSTLTMGGHAVPTNIGSHGLRVDEGD
jgi:hypothetical protein